MTSFQALERVMRERERVMREKEEKGKISVYDDVDNLLYNIEQPCKQRSAVDKAKTFQRQV